MQDESISDTPRRVVSALEEMTSGARTNVVEILGRTFNEPRYNEMVVLKSISFTSLCEHHLLPFSGKASVAYIPNQRVVGLSKLARLVEAHARRLQIQERMTVDIVEDLMRVLQPRGAGAIIEASHSCMKCRGVRQPESEMVTSYLAGVFRDNPETRSEFLSLVGRA